MKKIVFLTLLSLLTLKYKAQFNVRAFLLSGSGSYWERGNDVPNLFSKQHYKDELYRSEFRLAPGIFISGHQMVGLIAGYHAVLQQQITLYDYGQPYHFYRSSAEVISAGAFYRYYLPLKKDRVYVFFQAEGLFTRENSLITSVQQPRETVKGEGLGFSFRPGIAVTLGKRLLFETSLGNFRHVSANYSHSSFLGVWNSSQSETQVNLSFSTIQLGLAFYFGRKADETDNNVEK